MLHAQKLPYHFWAEAMHTTCHIHNRVTLRKGTKATQYELWKGRKPTVNDFHVFGTVCYVLVDREQRRKLDPKSDECIFMGYSVNSRAYRVYNKRTKTIIESINVVLNDTPEEQLTVEEEEEDNSPQPLSDQPNVPDNMPGIPTNEPSTISPMFKGSSTRFLKMHPVDNIIGNPNEGVITRSEIKLLTHASYPQLNLKISKRH
ncbi:hypothetical protein P8452_08938 [Trifolium repens]|nr:hypothetical protein P8452_08938 [Trifolium repens]